jgi:hypothetical protein
MKQSYLVLASLLGAATVAVAQPKLTAFGDMKVGDHYTYLSGPAPELDPGSAGKNVTWDFSAMKLPADTVRQEIITPSAAPHGSEFRNANLVENEEGRFIFVDKEGGINRLIGMVDVGRNMTMRYDRPFTFARRPLSFGDRYQDTATRSFSAGGFSYQGGSVNTLTADGYGTLILPDGRHPGVMRVRIEQRSSDTAAGGGNVMTVNTVTYAWYEPGRPEALLKLDQTTIRSTYYNDEKKEVKVRING